jgi:hypothetical protein
LEELGLWDLVRWTQRADRLGEAAMILFLDFDGVLHPDADELAYFEE